MDPVTREVIKLALMIFFTQMKAAGKTPEQMTEIYRAEREEFLTKDPKDLPDV